MKGARVILNIEICAFEQSNASYSHMKGKNLKTHVNSNEYADSYRFNPRSQILKITYLLVN